MPFILKRKLKFSLQRGQPTTPDHTTWGGRAMLPLVEGGGPRTWPVYRYVYLHVAIHTAAICAQIQCCSCIFLLLFFCAIMQCPTCGMGRSRRNWKPSQWAKSRPVTDGFIHCKKCSGELREDGLGWERPQGGEAVPPPPPVERPPRPMPP